MTASAQRNRRASFRGTGSVLWKLLLAILLSLVLAGVAGFTIQYWGEEQDLARLEMLGRLVSVGEFRLHIHCTGESKPGDPTLLLESGWGMPSAVWARTQPLLSKRFRTCVYDRAGYGWSEQGEFPRIGNRIAEEAEALIHAAGIDGELILVGHSYGGILVRLVAKRLPGRVTGIVLVDAVHEDMLRALPLVKQRMEERRGAMDLAPVLADFGLFRMTPWLFGLNLRGEEFQALSDAQWDRLRTFKAMPKQVRAALNELVFFELSLEQARAAGTWSNLPMVVVSAGKKLKPRWVPDDYTDEEYAAKWNELQMKLRKLRTVRPMRIIAENSGHEIPIQSPETIDAAVTRIMAERAANERNAAMAQLHNE